MPVALACLTAKQESSGSDLEIFMHYAYAYNPNNLEDSHRKK
jgi:hypothetical protein